MIIKTEKEKKLRVINPNIDCDWNRAKGAFWTVMGKNVAFIRVTKPCALPVDGCEWFDPSKTEYKELKTGDLLIREKIANGKIIYFAVSNEKFKDDFSVHLRQNPLKFDWTQAKTAVHTATGTTVRVLRLKSDFHYHVNSAGLCDPRGRRTRVARKGDVMLRGADGMIFDLPGEECRRAYDALPPEDPRSAAPPTMEPFLV